MSDQDILNSRTSATYDESNYIVETDPGSSPAKLQALKDKSDHSTRGLESAWVNQISGASIETKDNGDIILAANKFSQKIIGADGSQTDIAMQSNTVANRKVLAVDEIIVNNHKLNPQLWNLTDFNKLYDNDQMAIGSLSMLGSVLVRSWDQSLRKWVLTRRPALVPIFYNAMNMADAPAGMGINSDLTDLLRKYDDPNMVTKFEAEQAALTEELALKDEVTSLKSELDLATGALEDIQDRQLDGEEIDASALDAAQNDMDTAQSNYDAALKAYTDYKSLKDIEYRDQTATIIAQTTADQVVLAAQRIMSDPSKAAYSDIYTMTEGRINSKEVLLKIIDEIILESEAMPTDAAEYVNTINAKIDELYSSLKTQKELENIIAVDANTSVTIIESSQTTPNYNAFVTSSNSSPKCDIYKKSDGLIYTSRNGAEEQFIEECTIITSAKLDSSSLATSPIANKELYITVMLIKKESSWIPAGDAISVTTITTNENGIGVINISNTIVESAITAAKGFNDSKKYALQVYIQRVESNSTIEARFRWNIA